MLALGNHSVLAARSPATHLCKRIQDYLLFSVGLSLRKDHGVFWRHARSVEFGRSSDHVGKCNKVLGI